MGALITLMSIIFLALSVLWAIVFKKHAILRLICVAIRAVGAFIGTLITKASMIASGNEAADMVMQMIGESEISITPELAQIVLTLAAALLSVFIFVILYFALGIIMFLVRIIVGAILSGRNTVVTEDGTVKKKCPHIGIRAACGFVQGLIILTCVLVPASTYLNLADSAFTLAAETDEASKDSSSGVASMSMTTAVSAEQSSSDVITVPNNDQNVSSAFNTISELNNCFIFKAHRALGGKALSNSLTSMKFDTGKEVIKTNLNDEFASLMEMAEELMPLANTKFENYSEKEFDVINNLGTMLTKSKFLCAIIPEVLGEATEAWDNGEQFMGISKPSFDPTVDPLIDKTLSILATDSKDPKFLKDDLNTFGSVVTQIITAYQSSSAEGGEGLQNALLAEGLVENLLNTINANPRMRPLIPTVTNIGLSMIADKLGIDADAAESYRKLTEIIANELRASANLSADERQTNMEKTIKNALLNNNITNIQDTEISIISMSILSYFDGVTNPSAANATADDVNRFIEELLAAVASEAGGTAPVSATGEYGMTKLSAGTSAATEAGKLIAKLCAVQSNTSLDPAQKESAIMQLVASSPVITQNAAGLSSGMVSQITVSIVQTSSRDASAAASVLLTVSGLTPNEENTAFKYTAKAIMISDDVINSELSEESVGKMITSVSTVFNNMGDLMSSANGGDASSIGAVCNSLGVILDSFSENEELYGREKTDILLQTILSSETTREMTGMSGADVKNILDARADNNVSYGALMGTVSETVNTLTSIKNGEQESINTDNLDALIESLANEGSGLVIASIITPEKLVELGFKAKTPEQLNAASEFLKAVFTNLSAETQADRTKDVEALKHILTIVTDGANNQDTKDAFGEDGRLGCEASVLVDTILDSSAISKALYEKGHLLNTVSNNPFGLKFTESDIAEARAALNNKLATATEQKDRDIINALAYLIGITL